MVLVCSVQQVLVLLLQESRMSCVTCFQPDSLELKLHLCLQVAVSLCSTLETVASESLHEYNQQAHNDCRPETDMKQT